MAYCYQHRNYFIIRDIKLLSLDELKCDCEYIESCRGGCKYRAELFDDPFVKDLDRCAFYGILK